MCCSDQLKFNWKGLRKPNAKLFEVTRHKWEDDVQLDQRRVDSEFDWTWIG